MDSSGASSRLPTPATPCAARLNALAMWLTGSRHR